MASISVDEQFLRVGRFRAVMNHLMEFTGAEYLYVENALSDIVAAWCERHGFTLLDSSRSYLLKLPAKETP